jgi:peptidoglycan/LPS O-acetylase OafA/YrhL
MQARHIFPLTGIRLFAASWVVSYHFQGWLLELFPFLRSLTPFFGLGYEAVPLFFLLSGFILSHNYFSDYSLGQHPKFVFLRFARLWPVHFVTLVLFVLGPNLFLFKCNLLKSLFEELLDPVMVSR